MTTNGYHPTARCPEAARLWKIWMDLADNDQYLKHSQKRKAAFEEYMAHIQGGCNCRKGLGK